MRKLAVLSICVILVFLLAFSSSAIASDEDDMLQVLTNFARAMNNADFDLMSSLHSHSPDVSMYGPPKSMAFLIQGWEAFDSLWKGNLSYPSGTFNLSLHNLQSTMLTKDIGLVTGYSILTVNPPASPEQFSEQERFTYVVQKIGGKWLIVHIHVSVLPTE